MSGLDRNNLFREPVNFNLPNGRELGRRQALCPICNEPGLFCEQEGCWRNKTVYQPKYGLGVTLLVGAAVFASMFGGFILIWLEVRK